MSDSGALERGHRLVFVSYISRSGSTFLCKLLDEYKEISVGIEAGFPGLWNEIIPEKYRKIKTRSQLEQYLNELYGDIRFQQWGIDRKRLVERLEDEAGYPLTFRAILLCSLKEYFGKNAAEIFVHKAGFYIDHFNEVAEYFPGSKHIYVVRDPRAIFSSQKKARCIYSNRPMGASLAHFTAQYKRRFQLCQRYSADPNFLIVKYEEMVTNNNYVQDVVLPFLDIAQGHLVQSDYSKRIPRNQQFLHQNVGGPPDPRSIKKWEKGLRANEIVFLQNKLKMEMRKWGYAARRKTHGLGFSETIHYWKDQLKYWGIWLKNKSRPFLKHW